MDGQHGFTWCQFAVFDLNVHNLPPGFQQGLFRHLHAALHKRNLVIKHLVGQAVHMLLGFFEQSVSKAD